MPLLEEELTRSVIGAFYNVHRSLGFGFVEPVHAAALELELRSRGHDVARESGVNVYYRGVVIAQQRLDMVVDQKLVVEIKSTERLPRRQTTALQLFACNQSRSGPSLTLRSFRQLLSRRKEPHQSSVSSIRAAMNRLAKTHIPQNPRNPRSQFIELDLAIHGATGAP